MSIPITKSLFRITVILCLSIGVAGGILRMVGQLTDWHGEYGEGIVLWQAKHMLDTEYVYRRIDSPPFNVTHYPPLFHAATRLAHLWSHDWLIAGRFISIIAAIALAISIGVTTFSILPDRWQVVDRATAGLFAGGALFSVPQFGWLTLARVDSLGLFFSYVALAAFILAGENLAVQTLSLVLMAASGFTKQSLVSVPVACLLFQLVLDWRRAIRSSSRERRAPQNLCGTRFP